MSLLNYQLAPGRASIVTDTLAYNTSGVPQYFTSKVFAVPHLKAVVCDRGPALMAFQFQEWLNDTPIPGGLDGLDDIAPPALRNMHENFLSMYAGQLDPEHDQDQAETVVFGFSPKRGRVCATAFVSTEDFNPVSLPDGVFLVPSVTSTALPPKIRMPEGFIAAAKLQKRETESSWGYGIGGELVLCEVTKHAINMKTVHRFDDYDEMAGAIHEHAED